MVDHSPDLARKRPVWTPQSYLHGHPLERPEHFADALTVYNSLIEQNPANSLLHILRGRTLWNLDRDAEAQDSFLRALQLADQAFQEQPDNVRPQIYRADALWMLNRSEDALLAYDQAIQLAPDNYEAYLNKGWAKLILAHRHLEDALLLLQRAHALRPENADIVWRINVVYWETWQCDKSLAALEEAIALDPSQARFYQDMATTLSYLGRNEEAVEVQARADAMEAQELQAIEKHYRDVIKDDTASSF